MQIGEAAGTKRKKKKDEAVGKNLTGADTSSTSAVRHLRPTRHSEVFSGAGSNGGKSSVREGMKKAVKGFPSHVALTQAS